MATEEEKKLIRAYNVGYTLSAHEPKLLEKIIKQNKDNEFVKTMAIGRDHQEFHRGIPRKEFSREYKNGYHNAYALSANDPELLKQMMASKKLNNDFKKGLSDGTREYKIRETMTRMKNEREQQLGRGHERDEGIEL